MPVLALLVIFIASFSQRPVLAQELNDFIYSQGEKVPVSISPDRIGVIANPGTTPGQMKEFADSRGLDIVAQYEGGLFVLGQRSPAANRLALARSPREAKRLGGQLIREAGIVLTIPGSKTPVIVTDQLIVQFRPDVSRDRINELAKDNSVSILEENSLVKNQFVLQVNEGSELDTLQISNRFQAMSDLVVFSQPNFIDAAEPREFIPNDPLFADQWHHRNVGQDGGTPDADIDTPLAWDITQGAPETVIAIIDFGFDMAHPDLSPNIWRNSQEIPANQQDDDGNGFRDDTSGWDFDGCYQSLPCGDNDPAGSPLTLLGIHGTAAAGMAAARGNNGQGVSGSCPKCSLMLISVGNGWPTAYSVARAIEYAQRMRAAIISISFAYHVYPVIEAAINSAAAVGPGRPGIVILAAMDDRPRNDCAPGGFPNLDNAVIAVSGSSNHDQFDSFGYGDCMDILAPADGKFTGGRWITTTDMMGPAGFNNGRPNLSPPPTPPLCPSAENIPPPADAQDYTRCFSGTSAGTPLAAGVVGLVLTASPGLDRPQVQRLLQDTADKTEDSLAVYAPVNGFSHPPGSDSTHGWGRINAFEAVRVVAPAALGGRGGVDIFLRDNRLDWGNTEQPSNTLFEATRGTIGHWESMDIKVDAPPYQATPTTDTFDDFIDETPSAVSGAVNKVYVRVRNRGPVTAASVTMKLLWTQFGTALPPLPKDFWSAFPADSADVSQWHPLPCDATTASVCKVNNLAYSGASVAGTASDAAQIVAFDFPAPPVDPLLSNHFCLLAMVDSPQDPISLASRSSFFVDGITPTDNNVTHRNYLNLPTASQTSFVERFFVRNPFDRPLETALHVTAPDDWKVTSDPFGVDKPFDLKPLEQVLATLTVTLPKAGRKGIVTVMQEDMASDRHALAGGLSVRFQAKE